MFGFSEPIDVEYRRVMDAVGDDDPHTGQGYLGIKDILNAHFLIADFFYREGNGLDGVGPRSIDLLHSAIHRQHIAFEGKRKCGTGVIDLDLHDPVKPKSFEECSWLSSAS